jgi:hypothetical protein
LIKIGGYFDRSVQTHYIHGTESRRFGSTNNRSRQFINFTY